MQIKKITDFLTYRQHSKIPKSALCSVLKGRPDKMFANSESYVQSKRIEYFLSYEQRAPRQPFLQSWPPSWIKMAPTDNSKLSTRTLHHFSFCLSQPLVSNSADCALSLLIQLMVLLSYRLWIHFVSWLLTFLVLRGNVGNGGRLSFLLCICVIFWQMWIQIRK